MLNQIKTFDEKLANNVMKNLDVNIYYIEGRLNKQIEKLKNEDFLVWDEIKKYTITNPINLLLANRRYYRKGLYPVLLDDFIEKHHIKKLANKRFVMKENIYEFIKFEEWFTEVKKLKKEQAEYKKAFKKYYGNPSETTKECIDANYDCENCINAEICNIYKTTVSQKQISKFVRTLFTTDKNKYPERLTALKAQHEKEKQFLNKKIEWLEKDLDFYKKLYQSTDNELLEKRRILKAIKSKFHKNAFDILELIAEGYTMKYIAKKMNCTIPNIRQIKNKTIRLLNRIKECEVEDDIFWW